MKVQEKAIEALRRMQKNEAHKMFGFSSIAHGDYDVEVNNCNMIDIAIQALEEVEQYRALGTVEELKEAREKQIPKKVIYKPQDAIYQRPYCPTCGKELFDNNYSVGYCECGQALKWGEEDD